MWVARINLTILQKTFDVSSVSAGPKSENRRTFLFSNSSLPKAKKLYRRIVDREMSEIFVADSEAGC